MADFGFSPYAWGKDSLSTPGVGPCIADRSSGFDAKYGVPDELQRRLGDWSLRFGNDYDQPKFDWESFHREGRELTAELKRCLGAGFVTIYEKPIEAPDCAFEERTVFE